MCSEVQSCSARDYSHSGLLSDNLHAKAGAVAPASGYGLADQLSIWIDSAAAAKLGAASPLFTVLLEVSAPQNNGLPPLVAS